MLNQQQKKTAIETNLLILVHFYDMHLILQGACSRAEDGLLIPEPILFTCLVCDMR